MDQSQLMEIKQVLSKINDVLEQIAFKSVSELLDSLDEINFDFERDGDHVLNMMFDKYEHNVIFETYEVKFALVATRYVKQLTEKTNYVFLRLFNHYLRQQFVQQEDSVIFRSKVRLLGEYYNYNLVSDHIMVQIIDKFMREINKWSLELLANLLKTIAAKLVAKCVILKTEQQLNHLITRIAHYSESDQLDNHVRSLLNESLLIIRKEYDQFKQKPEARGQKRKDGQGDRSSPPLSLTGNPALDINEFERRSKNIIESYFKNQSLPVVRLFITELCTFSNISVFVVNVLNYAIETKFHDKRVLIAKLLGELIKDKVVEYVKLCEAISKLVQFAPTFIVDIPRFWEFLGEAISSAFVELNHQNRRHLLMASVLHRIVKTQDFITFFTGLVRFAMNQYGEDHVKNVFTETELDLITLFPPGFNVSSFFIANKIQFLLNITKRKSADDDDEDLSIVFENKKRRVL